MIGFIFSVSVRMLMLSLYVAASDDAWPMLNPSSYLRKAL